MSFALLIKNAKAESGSIGHVEASCMSIGMSNLECAVLPPGISNAAMPLDATILYSFNSSTYLFYNIY